MIGAVIITHGGLGVALVEAAEIITGKAERIQMVTVTGSDAPDGLRERIAAAVNQVNDGKGVVVFTDMFGGTPTNIALSFLDAGKVDILTGVNLPILIKFLGHRAEKTLTELTLLLKEYGRTSIVLAGDMLKEK
ncbi:MAG: PTS sugar transporter [Deltaproteobacteria bacterium]|nr:PTS sugar transporter [Deltaproteobacteria bacterium]